MSAATMNPHGQQLPHRKPVPARASYNNLQQPQQSQQPQQPPSEYSGDPYARTMTNTTNPGPGAQMYSAAPQQQQQQPQQYARDSRRTLSNATTSTTSTNNPGLQYAPTNVSGQPPRRSTSSRSATSASPTSYVALMRKQKATVWCDRAQVEDPNILAKRRQIKMQAAMEVAGGAHRYSTSSNAAQSAGIRSKIRHHGLPKANAYTGQGNLAGAGVPMRLSATEVDENDSDEEADSKYVRNMHSRNGSRGSSMGSGRHAPHPSYLSSNARISGYSADSTPRSGHSPADGISPDSGADQTPMPGEYQASDNNNDYFEGAAAEAEKSFGGIGGLPQKSAALQAQEAERQRRVSEDLRRRGSVDDRTMTMGGGRLFVANPDLSD